MPFSQSEPQSAGSSIWTTETIQTSDDTVTTIASIPILENTSSLIEARISGVRADKDEGIGVILTAGFVNKAGTVTRQGEVNYSHKTFPANWDVTLDIDGTSVDVNVKGHASKVVDWKCLYSNISI